MKNEAAKKYSDLILLFLNGEVSATRFEFEYLRVFQYDDEEISEELYEIINTLFYSVDDFVSDISLREEGDVDEAALKEACRIAYYQLRAIM